MLNKIYLKINALTVPRNNWFFGLTALVLSLVMVVFRLVDNLAALMGYTGDQSSVQPMFAPDAGAFSTPANLYAVLTAYGDTGRRVYVFNSLLFDLAYPVFYSLALATLLNLVLGKLAGENSSWRKLSLVPLLGGGLDLLENLTFYILIVQFPARLDGLAVISNFLTTSKGVVTYLCLGLLVVLACSLPFVQRHHQAARPETQP